ncbi:MAG: sigma-70 family RNA polymerase sigma factor [Verrucomicrobiota bacterium]|jgi:RNA polymerase sigma-70 factor (ECF subfamily)
MDITQDRVEIIDAGESLARARAGDAEAFCRLTGPLQTRLLRQAVALSGDVSAAEDLVSETLLEAWKSLARYDESCRFSTWLYAILLHRHQKWRRRARSRPVALARLPVFQRERLVARQENVPAPELSPAEDAARNENSARLRQCVARLPEKHRRIILLRFFEDASLSDMARVLGCPAGTVKSRLHHALEKLRKLEMNLPETRGDTQI